MASTTYDLFFTGRDDPRSCVIIGEDTKPVYFCFETAERNLLTPNVRTMVSSKLVLVPADKLMDLYLSFRCRAFIRSTEITRKSAPNSNGVRAITLVAQPLGIARCPCPNSFLQAHLIGTSQFSSSMEQSFDEVDTIRHFP